MFSITVIIPVYNKIEVIASCIRLNWQHCTSKHRWVIIDNASDQNTKNGLFQLKSEAELAGHQFVIIAEPTNTGVAKAWNKGLQMATSPYVCILNNDCVMMPEWDTLLIRKLETDNFHLISPLILESEMFAGGYTLHDFLEGDRCYKLLLPKNAHRDRKGMFGGVVIFGKKSTFDAIGFFDENLWLSLEEMDYFYRASLLKLRVAMCGCVLAYHMSGLTRRSISWNGENTNQAYFEKKWGWNYEKVENTFLNKVVKKIQKYLWRHFYIFSEMSLAFPKHA